MQKPQAFSQRIHCECWKEQTNKWQKVVKTKLGLLQSTRVAESVRVEVLIATLLSLIPIIYTLMGGIPAIS